MKTKRCPKCKIEKPISEFGKDKSRKDFLCPQCRECRKKKQREYEHTEKRKIYRKKYLQSINGKATQKRYRKSEKGKQTIRRFNKTDKGRAISIRAANNQRKYHPERIAAEHAIEYQVRIGKIPYPYTLECVECGKQAQQYHHYKGYAKEHWLDVEPVCIKCHAILHC